MRLQCGKTNYESCEDFELRRFVHDRKLLTVAAPLQQIIKRDVLIELLKTADDQQSFDKFLDLPPELRERIAKYYIREFGAALTFPTQPPLARTSRLVRREVLPLFYQRCVFELHYEGISGNRIKPCSKTLEWLHALGPENFASIRRLYLKANEDARSFDSVCGLHVVVRLKSPLWNGPEGAVIAENVSKATKRRTVH